LPVDTNVALQNDSSDDTVPDVILAATHDETPVASVIQVHPVDHYVPDGITSAQPSDVAPVALPVRHQPVSSVSLLLDHESYFRVYNTRPLWR
jgi:hypothetical protein